MMENHASDLYDAVNAWSPSDDFFLRFLTASHGSSGLDLGCGTGRITVAAAEAGCRLVGIDPDRASLEAARAKPGAQRVRWIEGTSSAIPAGASFDVVIMSSNVVQAILDDTALTQSFGEIAAHLAPGGRLAFDARDPDARGWEAWTKNRSQRTVRLPDGEVQHWYQTTHVDEETGLVDFGAHEITPSGIERVEPSRIRFRSQAEIRALLRDAGLEIESVSGGYSSEPVGQGLGALVVTARHEQRRTG